MQASSNSQCTLTPDDEYHVKKALERGETYKGDVRVELAGLLAAQPHLKGRLACSESVALRLKFCITVATSARGGHVDDVNTELHSLVEDWGADVNRLQTLAGGFWVPVIQLFDRKEQWYMDDAKTQAVFRYLARTGGLDATKPGTHFAPKAILPHLPTSTPGMADIMVAVLAHPEVLGTLPGDLALIRQLLSHFLFAAVERQDYAMLFRLLKAGVDPNAPRPEDGVTAFQVATAAGDTKMVELLMRSERFDTRNLHTRNAYGNSASNAVGRRAVGNATRYAVEREMLLPRAAREAAAARLRAKVSVGSASSSSDPVSGGGRGLRLRLRLRRRSNRRTGGVKRRRSTARRTRRA